MSKRTYLLSRALLSFSLLFGASLFAGCGGTQVTEVGENLNGTCINCHSGLTNPHPLGAAISCVGCHGGDATVAPFKRAGADVEALLLEPDPTVLALNEAAGVTGRFVPINPTKLADANDGPFADGRNDAEFQVLLTSAHNLPKGCAGPREIEAQPILDIDPLSGEARTPLDEDGSADLDGDGDARDRVQIGKLTPQQRQNVVNTGVNDDCHAVFFYPNGMNDDGDVALNGGQQLVDELGEFASVNPNDPVGLVYELSKIDLNQNGVIDPGEGAAVSLNESKTIQVNVATAGIGLVEVPVKIGNFYDSEINLDVNYVRWMNPGDVRTADASCGSKSRGNSFAGACHETLVHVVRRSIMSYMSGVLAGAIYANGAIPNSRSLIDAGGETDRQVQDLRDGRIGYLQNYDSLDGTFDPDLNRYVLDVAQSESAVRGLREIFIASSDNQDRLNDIFSANFVEDVDGDDQRGALVTIGLEQDDALEPLAVLNDVAAFTGNLGLESYPEELGRVDNVVSAFLDAQGVDPAQSITNEGKFTVASNKDVAAGHRPGNRLIWDQVPLQDPQRSLFLLAPIPRRTLTGFDPANNAGNAVFFNNANLVSVNVTGQDVVSALALQGIAVPPPDIQDAVLVNGILDDRQFARLGGINPVDTALQTFRPFHSLSFPNISGDFNFFDEKNLLDNNANNDVFVARNNAHGRGRGTGCTSCHMLYDQDGVNREPNDPTVRNNGKQPGDIFLGKSPLVNNGVAFRSIFNAGNDAVAEAADAQGIASIDSGVVGNALTGEIAENLRIQDLIRQSLGLPDGEALPRMQYPTGMDDFGRERFYPSVHKLTTQIPSRQCEYCHGFVTRAGFAAVGRHENEGGMDFINWYTLSPRDALDVDGAPVSDGKIKHKIITNAAGVNDATTELGRFVNNRAASPETDFLEFRNAVDPNQKVRIFNNLPGFDGTNAVDPIMRNLGDRFSEDLNGNGLLDPGENRSDLADGEALDQPDRPGRSVIIDGRQQRAVYGGASGGVLLQEIHLERGMHCGDCHLYQDDHGDGNVYARNWDAIEIECEDCHGTTTKAGTFVTSGANGGHDLTKSKDQFGVAFFEIGNKGERIQRSHVVPGREWRVPQVIDAINPKNEDGFNKEAAEAMAILNADGVTNAHIPEQILQVNEGVSILRSGVRGVSCNSCHSSWTPNCFTCHMDFDHSQTVSEIWATQQRNPISFFQLFTIIRSPFVLANSGSNDHNRITTQRSLMELHPNVTLNTGDALVENFTFTSARGMSGLAMNQYFSHTVRLKETKDCDTCHTLTSQDLAGLNQLLEDDESPFDEILNNNILAQTLGFGSGRFGESGDYAFAGSAVGLEQIDIKAEVKRAIDADGDGFFANTAVAVRNTFQGFRGQGFGSGFLVSSNADRDQTDSADFDFDAANPNGRSATEAIAGGLTDTVFIRNFVDPTEADPNSGQFIGAVRAMDIVVGATGTDLTVRIVTDRGAGAVNGPLNLQSLALEDANNNTLGGNITAIDHVSPDMSSQFIYAVTDNGQIAVVDLRKLIAPGAGGVAFDGFNRAGFNGQAIAAEDTDATRSFTDIEIEGNFAFTLDKGLNNDGFLRIFFARQLRRTDRVVDNDNTQVAGDFLLETPGDLSEVGAVNLDTCTDPRRIAIMNVMAYIACGVDGLFVVNIENPKEPRVIAQISDAAVLDFNNPGTPADNGTINDAQGVFAMDNRVYIANGNAGGNAGVMLFDVTSPKNPIAVHTYVDALIVDPVDISGFIEPGEHWLLVSDSVGRAHAINVTEAYNIRVRLGEHAAAARGLLDDDAEANGSVPGFRPETDLVPFASQANLAPVGVREQQSAGLLNERPFFEFTNVRFTLDLRDVLTPNDPANIDDLIDGTPQIITFNLGGGGDVRLSQFHDLDRMADWSGFEERDSWASAVNLNTDCNTDALGDIGGITETDPTDEGCASDLVNNAAAGELGSRVLSGPSFKIVNGDLVLVRGQMDTMRGVFVQEVDGIDLDGNGLGNLRCIAIGQRDPDDGFTLNALEDCQNRYPADVRDAIFGAARRR